LAVAAALAAFGGVCAAPAAAALADPTAAQTESVQAAPTNPRAVASRPGRGYLVDMVQIDAGQKARLNVVLLEPGPRHCRVQLSIVDRRGNEVRHGGPVSLNAGSATHLQVAGPGSYRAFLRVAEKRCESAVKADVEVF
jgi:hypothetical protein